MMKAILSVALISLAAGAAGCSNAQAERIPNDNDETNSYALSVNDAKKPCLCKDSGIQANTLGVISVELARIVDPATQNEVAVYKASCRAYRKEKVSGGEVTTAVICSEFQSL